MKLSVILQAILSTVCFLSYIAQQRPLYTTGQTRYRVPDEAQILPLNVFVTVSSRAPVTSFETSVASLDENDIEALMDKDFVAGLGKMTDYPDLGL